MKFLGNGIVFVVVYIVFMLPTYLLPYVGSNSAVLNAAGAAAETGTNPAMVLHLICLAVLVVATWFRGALVNMQWLVILPILAAIFDLVPGLSLIPLVPTVLHIFALVKGVSGTPQDAVPASQTNQ